MEFFRQHILNFNDMFYLNRLLMMRQHNGIFLLTIFPLHPIHFLKHFRVLAFTVAFNIHMCVFMYRCVCLTHLDLKCSEQLNSFYHSVCLCVFFFKNNNSYFIFVFISVSFSFYLHTCKFVCVVLWIFVNIYLELLLFYF